MAAIGDHNANGKSEIELLAHFWRDLPSGCGSRPYLFEWQGNYTNGRFVNIASSVTSIGTIDVGSCGAWQFYPTAPGQPEQLVGVDTFANAAGADCPPYERQAIYEWQGRSYEWIKDYAPSFRGTVSCGVGWANLAGSQDPRSEALLQEALSRWPAELDAIWGPSAQDYFRYQLGIGYAFRGQVAEAQRILETVRDHPNDQQHNTVSELAALFLGGLQSGSAEAACQAVSTYLDTAPMDVMGQRDMEQLRLTWGIADPLWYALEAYGSCGNGLSAWTHGHSDTVEVEAGIYETIESIEQEIFDRRDNAAAQEDLLELMANPDFSWAMPQVRPQLIYLLGLTHELEGNDVAAVDHYWQLCQDYPDSPYSLAAQAKLLAPN